MKPLTIDPENGLVSRLLWRLATVYGPMHQSDLRDNGTDICEYTKAVIRGLFIVLCITAIGGLGAFAIGDMLAWWAAVITMGTFMDMGLWSRAGHGVTFLAAICFLAFCAGEAYLKYAQKRRQRKWAREAEEMTEEPAPPGMLTEMYLAWKHKYCVKITVK